MDVLLGLVVKVSREYGFSAFVLALLMIVFYSIVTNKQLISVADRVLNRSLTRTSLYKFVKLGVILVFAFSTVVAILSFATPVIMRQVENRSLELILQGKTAFEAHKYGEARDRLEQSLTLMNPDDPSADEIRGLITATYYVGELHEQGLDFICEQYRNKPASDRSYLFAAHAHIRKIAVNETTERGELTATKYRRKCDRPDFSRFWAHIPFGMMESLRISRLRTEHSWELSEKSATRLRVLLEEEQQAALSKTVPFGDFTLYFLGEFDALLSTYEKSSIRDMALFDAAMFASETGRIQYLATLIEKHPASQRFADAVLRISKLLAAQGNLDKALSYVSLIKSRDALDQAASVALEPTFKALSDFIRSGKLDAAKALVATACKSFEERKLPCDKGLIGEKENIDKGVRIVATKYKALPCTATQAKLRQLSVLDDKTTDARWLHASRSLLVSCLEDAQTDPDDYAKSLYLVGALSRRVGDYKTSLQYLLRFEREVSEHDLLDDVLTEIGYHKFVIEQDWPTAKRYFERVIGDFPQRNAYDNALWWHAKGSTRDGQYQDAIAAYARITGNEIASRFKDWSGEEQLALQRLTRFPPFIGVSLKPGLADEGGLKISNIEADAPAGKVLAVGDRLVGICDKRIYGIEAAMVVISQMEPKAPCNVQYLRGRKLLQLSRGAEGAWQTQSVELTKDQLRDLALGQRRT